MYHVYILCKDEKPIYIGCTSNVRKRVSQHKDKDFTSHVILKSFKDRKDALTMERSIIQFLSAFKIKGVINKFDNLLEWKYSIGRNPESYE